MTGLEHQCCVESAKSLNPVVADPTRAEWMTHSAWKTPRQPGPCAGPRMGRKCSNRCLGLPASERVRTAHSKTHGHQLWLEVLFVR